MGSGTAGTGCWKLAAVLHLLAQVDGKYMPPADAGPTALAVQQSSESAASTQTARARDIPERPEGRI